MAVEIERKFLVNELAYSSMTPYLDIVQGYMSNGPITTRVRYQRDGELGYEKGFITLKGSKKEYVSSEYEYEIPYKDAIEIIDTLATSKIRKRRYLIKHANHLWEVDKFLDKNQGLYIAEIKLKSIDEKFVYPFWIGKEVTSDSRFSNLNLSINPYEFWQNS